MNFWAASFWAEGFWATDFWFEEPSPAESQGAYNTIFRKRRSLLLIS